MIDIEEMLVHDVLGQAQRLKDDVRTFDIQLKEVSKELLELLLYKAIRKIDYQKLLLSGNSFDERDSFDMVDDEYSILLELLDDAIKFIKTKIVVED